MVVQHNLTAMNSNRMLGITQGTLSKSTEKLSSGYKVNRAADDAAGLSISEKMRKQVRGLTQASLNAQDGISSVQTAEGALTEVHDMLQRMNELAVKASNGTMSDSDRQTIQDEVDQLLTEVDRVSETTKFNETYLLKGEVDGATKSMTLAAHDAGLKGKLTVNDDGTTTFALEKKVEAGDKISIAGTEYNIAKSSKAEDYTILSSKDFSLTIGDTLTAEDGTEYRVTKSGAIGTAEIAKIKADGSQETAVASSATNVVAGMTLTHNGKTTELVGKGGYTTLDDTKVSAKDLDALTAELKTLDGTKGIKIKIGSDADPTANTEYTLSAVTDKASNKYCLDDLLAEVIKEGDIIAIGKNDGSASFGDNADSKLIYLLPAKSENDNDITVTEAYKKMTDALTQASSIGADTGKEATVKADIAKGEFTIKQASVEVKKSLSFSLHVGADADMTNKIGVQIDAMSTRGLGIKDLNVKDKTGVAATYAVDAIADAVAKVSATRSALGAVQNRLEHTIKNLDNVVENTTAAESQIRDTDMATEMVKYSNTNILSQAGQSMLAQANQSNQGILSLLR